jgi:hypothetical protein
VDAEISINCTGTVVVPFGDYSGENNLARLIKKMAGIIISFDCLFRKNMQITNLKVNNVFILKQLKIIAICYTLKLSCFSDCINETELFTKRKNLSTACTVLEY